MNYLTTQDGLKLAYYMDDFSDPWRDAETVVLLHGAMGNSQRFYQWVPSLASRYKVIRLDMRGHGSSNVPQSDAPFSLQDLVDDVLALLDTAEVDKAHIVGNSAGGYVGQKLAIQHPARVSTLALYGSTPGLKNSQALSWIPLIQKVGLEKFLSDTIADRFDDNADPDLVKWFIRQAGSNDPEFIGRFVSHMCTHDFMDELTAIQCPTLIVAAGKETIGHAQAYDEMARLIKNAEVRYYDTHAHNICDNYALKCVTDLMHFLDRHASKNG